MLRSVQTLTRWAAPEPTQPAADSDCPGSQFLISTPLCPNCVSTRPSCLDLGLVFELLVEVDDLKLGTAAVGRQLSIRCDEPLFLQRLVTSPWTRYDLTGTAFRPAPAPGSNSGIRAACWTYASRCQSHRRRTGQDLAAWAVGTFDVDGVVGNLRQAGRDITANPQMAATMPPMRSVGFALLRPDRAGVRGAPSPQRGVQLGRWPKPC